jgi:hypothetical protein
MTDEVKKLPQKHGVLLAVSITVLMSGSELVNNDNYC